jgi:hypothetical protein
MSWVRRRGHDKGTTRAQRGHARRGRGEGTARASTAGTRRGHDSGESTAYGAVVAATAAAARLWRNCPNYSNLSA